jgi:hypothetical protein
VRVMLKQNLGSLSSADADNISLEPGQGEDEISANASALAQSVRDQLAREVADIEAATVALRRAEPELESWTRPAALAARKARPVWLIIGALWLSTALVTAGAVVAIATFAG